MTEPDQTEAMSGGGCLLRLIWAFLGPVFVGFVCVELVLKKPPVGSALDLALAGGMIAAIAARILDRQKPGNAPGTWDIGNISPRLYGLCVLAAGLLVFIIVHFNIPRFLSYPMVRWSVFPAGFSP